MADVAVTNTFTTNTTIASSQVNTNFADLVTYINNRNNGTAWASFAVTGNATVGGTLGITGATSFLGIASIADGTSLLPSLACSSSANTGIYYVGANRLGLSANGSNVLTLQSGILTVGGLVLTSSDGTNSAPVFSWASDLDNGMYRIGTNNVGLAAGGAKVLDLSATVVNVPVSLTIGTGALATNATDGFLYIPSCAGTPTGTPTTVTGRVPMIYDTTNHKFYIYDSGWKGGTVPGVFS